MRLEQITNSFVRRTGLASAVQRIIARRRLSILLYHDPRPETLARHLDYLKQRYSGVELSRAVDAMRHNAWDTLPDYPLAITFDDGWKGNVAAVDVCREYGFPVTIYACSQIVGTHRHFWWTNADESLKQLSSSQRRGVLAELGVDERREYMERLALSADEIRLMSDIAEFGAHTRFHPILTVCTDDEAWNEISVSREEMEALTNRPCTHFAYPNGDYTEREVNMLRHAGFLSARTTDIGWNTSSTDPYRLRCLGTLDHATLDRLAADLAGAGFLWRWRETGRWDGRHRVITPPRTSDVRTASSGLPGNV